MLGGSSQPFNVQTATANFMARIVLKPTKRKERRKTTKAFVKAGENVWNVPPNFILIPTSRISVTMSPALTVENLSMSTIDVSFSRSSRKKTPPKKTHLKIPWHFKMRMMTRMKRKVHPLPPVLNFADIECSLTEERVFMRNLICWSSEEDDETVVYGNRRPNCTLFSGKPPKGHGPWINSAMAASF